MNDKKMYHSCESVDDVIFYLNGDRHAGLGWVVFEIDDEKHRQVTGAIGLSNNIFALKLLRHFNTQQPLRIVGDFIDSKERGTDSYVLDNITTSGMLFNDTIGFVLFRATALQIDTTALR